jgi:hypothetical protein
MWKMFAAHEILTSTLAGSILKIMATVKLTSEADEQMARLPKAIKERVAKILTRLEDWPNVSGVKRLSGNLAGRYRTRGQRLPNPLPRRWRCYYRGQNRTPKGCV